jgi:hypothetical protein
MPAMSSEHLSFLNMTTAIFAFKSQDNEALIKRCLKKLFFYSCLFNITANVRVFAKEGNSLIIQPEPLLMLAHC